MKKFSTLLLVMMVSLLAGLSLQSCSSSPVDKFLGYVQDSMDGKDVDNAEAEKFLEENKDYELTKDDKAQILKFVETNLDKEIEKQMQNSDLSSDEAKQAQEYIDTYKKSAIDQVEALIDSSDTLGEVASALAGSGW